MIKFWYNFLYFLLWPVQKIVYPFRVTGRENLPLSGAILCANHTQLIDAPLAFFAFGRKYPVHFMGKAELFKIPLLGPILRAMGAFPVNRGETDITSARHVIKLLKDEERVMMFPEGTRVSEGDQAEAKTGAIRYSLKMKVPIVPMYISGNKKPFRRVIINIGKPFFPDKPVGKNYEPITDDLMNRIFALEKVN